MRYFKIIKDNQFIGAISSENFIFRNAFGGFHRTNDQYGELAVFNGTYYRATWMVAYEYDYPSYIEASILPISEDEYNAFIHAEESNEEITAIEEEEEELEQEVVLDPVTLNELDYLRSSKIKEMSQACKATIEAGFDLELRGETRHFSLTTQDQLNLMSLSVLAQDQTLIPYHADGEAYEFYTANEINSIITAANELKNYNTAYYNSLKAYLNSLQTIEDIAAITYGTPIPEEYKSDVLKVLEY